MKIKFCVGSLLLVAALVRAQTNDLTALLQQGLLEEQANRNFDAAIADYQSLALQFDKDRQLAATAVFRLGECYRAQGRTNEAAVQYQRILHDFSDQLTLATLSRQDLAGMGLAPAGAGKITAGGETASAVPPSAEASVLATQISGIEKLKPDLEEQARAVLAIFPDDLLKQMLLHLPNLQAQAARMEANPQLSYAELTGTRGYSVAIGSEEDPLGKVRREMHSTNLLTDARSELSLQHQAIAERVDFILGLQKARLKALQVAAGPESLASEAAPPLADDEGLEIQRIEQMVKNSPDLVNAPQGGDETPLCHAADKGQLRVAQFLLEHGADVQRDCPLVIAAKSGHKAMVELLLNHGAQVNAARTDGQTALHCAAMNGYLSVTKTLLAAKAEVNAQTENGRTPLILAVQNGVVPVAAALLAQGADPNIICGPGQDGRADRKTTGAALHFAVGGGDEAMVALLLTNRADLTLRNPLGESALDIAAILGKTGIARQLVAAGADVNAVGSAQGDKTPLLYGTAGGFRELVTLLLEHGANPNVTPGSDKRYAPLMSAASQGNSEIIALLLHHKADPNLADANGETALEYAIRRQQPAAVRTLLAGGANPDTRCADGRPMLVVAVADAVNEDLVAALIEAKANVNATDPRGLAPLHWAAERGRKDLVELLVKAGAEVNRRDKSGATPLDYAKSANAAAGRIPGPGLPPPSSYPGNNSASPTTLTTNTLSLAELLRHSGALDELPDFTRIRITRQGWPQPVEVFHQKATLTNRFTLLETVMRFYSQTQVSPPGRPQQQAWMALPFPDFGRIIIRRPSQNAGGKAQETKVSLLNRSNVVDCAQDVPVEFGDVIEIPESVHALNAGMPNPVQDMEEAFALAKPDEVMRYLGNHSADWLPTAAAWRTTARCLQKSVQLVVAGETTTFNVNSWKEGFLSWALTKTEARSVLRSSSDLSRITVTRKPTASSQPTVFTVDVSGSAPNNDDLWLQDGDVITVPEKP